MKKYLSLIILVLLFVWSNNAFGKNNKKHYLIYEMHLIQDNKDTLSYLQNNIIANKNKFQHKELNNILNELQLDIKSYYFSFNSKHTNQIKSITLFFDNSAKNIGNPKFAPFLVVYFEDQIPANRALGLSSKDMGKWGDEEKAFYGKFLVKDITVSKK